MTEHNLAVIKATEHGLVLSTLDAIRDVSQIILQSGMAPDGYKKKEQIFVAIQSGLERGLKPIQALNSIAIIKGRPTLWGDAMLGLVKTSGLLAEYSETLAGEGDEMVATVRSVRKQEEFTTEVVTSFSVQDAKTAGLWGKQGPWKTHPKRMLKYKARAFNLRDNFSDVLMGMHMAEEMIGEEPLPVPDCATPPRDQRRKAVESTQTTPIEEEPAQDAEAGSSLFKEETATEEPKEEIVSSFYEAVVQRYLELRKDPEADFAAWAAFVLCVDPDEINFDEGTLKFLKNEMETKGVQM